MVSFVLPDPYMRKALTNPRPTDARLASSIHTIHRPVARSRRASGPPSPTLSIPPTPVINYKAYAPSVPDVPEQESEGATPSEEELEPEDFEATSSSPVAEHSASLPNQGLSSRNEERAPLPPRKFNLRTLSMGTVKVQRRARLAEKLKEVFELNGIEEVWAGVF
jgi:sterol 3beta-glucosyltransferase